MILGEITTALIFLFFGGAVLLAIRLLTVRWWRTPIGRITAYTVGVYVIVGALAIMSAAIGPDYPGREVVRVACWGVIAAIPWAQLLVFQGAQRSGAGAPTADVMRRAWRARPADDDGYARALRDVAHQLRIDLYVNTGQGGRE